MVRKLLLLCGVISSILYLAAIDLIAPLLHPEYHDYTSQMVSELMAVGAPTRSLLVWLFLPYNLLLFAFAIGVWVSAGNSRAGRFTVGSLSGFAVVSTVGLLLTPMDVRGTVGSQRDPLHIACTIVMSIFIVSAIASGAFLQGRRFRRYSFATITTVIVFGALAGLLARPLAEQQPTPWLGLAERVNIYATMVWVAVLAAALRRAPGEPGEPCGPPLRLRRS